MLHGQMLNRQMLHAQMLHGQMLHGQMSLGHLLTVKDNDCSTNSTVLFPGMGLDKSGI